MTELINKDRFCKVGGAIIDLEDVSGVNTILPSYDISIVVKGSWLTLEGPREIDGVKYDNYTDYFNAFVERWYEYKEDVSDV